MFQSGLLVGVLTSLKGMRSSHIYFFPHPSYDCDQTPNKKWLVGGRIDFWLLVREVSWRHHCREDVVVPLVREDGRLHPCREAW